MCTVDWPHPYYSAYVDARSMIESKCYGCATCSLLQSIHQQEIEQANNNILNQMLTKPLIFREDLQELIGMKKPEDPPIVVYDDEIIEWSANCSSCGAPITGETCEYCGRNHKFDIRIQNILKRSGHICTM